MMDAFIRMLCRWVGPEGAARECGGCALPSFFGDG